MILPWTLIRLFLQIYGKLKKLFLFKIIPKSNLNVLKKNRSSFKKMWMELKIFLIIKKKLIMGITILK